MEPSPVEVWLFMWSTWADAGLPAGTAALTPVLISGTITSLPGFFGSTGSLMSDPEVSDADTPSSSALICQMIGLAAVRTVMCTFMRIAVGAFDEARGDCSDTNLRPSLCAVLACCISFLFPVCRKSGRPIRLLGSNGALTGQ